MPIAVFALYESVARYVVLEAAKSTSSMKLRSSALVSLTTIFFTLKVCPRTRFRTIAR